MFKHVLWCFNFLVQEGNRALPSPPPSLASLRNLSIDTRLSAVLLTGAAVLSEILSYIGDSSPSLVSFVVKYPDRQMSIPNRFIQQLIAAHASTLKSVSFLACTLGTADSLPALCRACVKLERLEISIPARDWVRLLVLSNNRIWRISCVSVLEHVCDRAQQIWHAAYSRRLGIPPARPAPDARGGQRAPRHGARPDLEHNCQRRADMDREWFFHGGVYSVIEHHQQRRKDAQGALVVGLELRPMHSAGINVFMPRESWR